MKKLFFVLFLLLLSINAFAADEFRPATPEELAIKDVPWAPGASAVILDWTVKHDDESSFANEYVRIKVLSEDGKKYGTVELLSIPRYHAVRNIEARTIKPDGTFARFEGKVYEKTVIKRGGVKLLQKSFTLPDVQPGTIIEYRHTVTWPTSDLRTNRWMLQREIPIAKASFNIRPARTVRSICTTKGLPPELKAVRDREWYRLNLEKVAAFVEEPYSLPEQEVKPRLEFFYLRGNASDYWIEIGEAYGKFVEEFIGNRSGIKKVAEELTADAQDDDTKLRKLYARVQELRNLTYERDRTEAEEKREKLRDANHVEDVLKFGYGYRNQLNRLFVAMARSLGFEGSMALVSERDDVFFTRELPDIQQLEGELAVITIGGKDRFFDPGTPYTRFGLLSWENTNVPALKLIKKGAGLWIETPSQAYSAAQVARAADLQLDGDTLKGTVTITYRGQEALVKRLEARNEDEKTNNERFESNLKSLFADGAVVKLKNVANLTGTDQPLVITYDVELPNLVSETPSRTMIPVSVFASSVKNPFSSEQRTTPVYFSYESQVEDKVTIKVPESYAVESFPKPVLIDVGGAAFSASWAGSKDALTFERKMTFKTIAIGPAQYKTLRNFFGNALSADQQAVVLRRQ
jgi:Domain of Unknown Function with PDB structure (DUF3857)/Transglutaminase-like superfamily